MPESKWLSGVFAPYMTGETAPQLPGDKRILMISMSLIPLSKDAFAYSSFPARVFTANTTTIYASAMTLTQMLAFTLPILRKIRDKIAAAAATTTPH